jgi:hypothetical protein
MEILPVLNLHPLNAQVTLFTIQHQLIVMKFVETEDYMNLNVMMEIYSQMMDVIRFVRYKLYLVVYIVIFHHQVYALMMGKLCLSLSMLLSQYSKMK